MKKKRKVAGPFQDLYRQSACLGPDLASVIFSSAQSTVGSQLHSHLGSQNYDAIVSATVNPMDYTTADGFSRDYLCVELMSKYPNWDLGVDRTAVALEKFWQVESDLMKLTFSENPTLYCGENRTTLRAVEETARRKIGRILGDVDLNEVSAFFAFGPGASTSQKRLRGDAAYKFGAENPQLTYNASLLATTAKAAFPTWPFTADVVGGARLTTVPKNAKTDRVICIEPDLNMFFQKGLGKVIRRRLQRWGLLLHDAQERNALFAREGSANGRLATVDLSSASDSIHMELVRRLLPPDWTALIEQMRSPSVVLPTGDIVHLRKVSSMGNGFTFELETLIFYALSSSVVDLLSSRTSERQCTVFGDDIIIASELVGPLEEVLSFFGFVMNSKKTFSTGPFRESCGKHYFSGTDVTPFYIRKPIDTVLRKYWAANSIRRYSRNPVWGLDGRWQPAYELVVSHIPPFFRRYKIPEGFGDGGLVSDWDEVCPVRAKDQNDAWEYESISPRFKGEQLVSHGVLLKSLHKLDFGSVQATSDAYRKVPYALMVKTLFPEFYSDSDEDPYYRMFTENGWISQRAKVVAELVKLSSKGAKQQKVRTDEIPKPSGYRSHKSLAWKWPTFGPWL